MATDGSSDKWIAIVGITSAITGVSAFLRAPGGPRWDLLLPVTVGAAVFLGAHVLFDRKMVRTGRVSEKTSILVFVGSLFAVVAVLFVIAPD